MKNFFLPKKKNCNCIIIDIIRSQAKFEWYLVSTNPWLLFLTFICLHVTLFVSLSFRCSSFFNARLKLCHVNSFQFNLNKLMKSDNRHINFFRFPTLHLWQLLLPICWFILSSHLILWKTKNRFILGQSCYPCQYDNIYSIPDLS